MIFTVRFGYDCAELKEVKVIKYKLIKKVYAMTLDDLIIMKVSYRDLRLSFIFEAQHQDSKVVTFGL